MGGQVSDFLFARPSFLEGAARTLDLGDTLREYNESLTPEQADAVALRSDWAMVGQDLGAAMQSVAEDLARDAEGAPEA